MGESFALYIEGIKITVGNANSKQKSRIQQEILNFYPKFSRLEILLLKSLIFYILSAILLFSREVVVNEIFGIR